MIRKIFLLLALTGGILSGVPAQQTFTQDSKAVNVGVGENPTNTTNPEPSISDSLYEKNMIGTDMENASSEYKYMTATDSLLCKIISHIDNIVLNTKPAFWKTPEFIAAFALFISIVACLGTCLGAWWQRRSEKNTRAIRQIQKEQQGFLLLDFIRHLYRNKVVICALQWQLEEKYDTHYPFDEHILKLHIPLEELELDRFADSSGNFDDLHKLRLQCRNVNIEIGIAYEHLKNKSFPRNYKKYDLKTLEFKCQYVTHNIIKLMYELNLLKEDKWDTEIKRIAEDDTLRLPSYDENKAKKAGKYINEISVPYLQKIRLLLFDRIQDNKGEKPKIDDYLKERKYRKEEKKYQRESLKYRYYDDVLQFGDQLNYDIYMEGKGKHGGEGVIKLIEFGDE